MLKGVTVSRSGARFSSGGPGIGEWLILFIVHAPKDAGLDLEAKNGPIDVADINGKIKLRATNGPISISDCRGEVRAHAVNGPISYTGSGGDVAERAEWTGVDPPFAPHLEWTANRSAHY